LRLAAERLRRAQAFGRSQLIHLFDFLLDCSIRGEAPTQYDIASRVLSLGQGFDASQDASVRVYMHRLRQKLDEYYAGDGRDETVRLTIPRGEYRLDVETQEQAVPEKAKKPPLLRWNRPVLWFALGLALVATVNAAMWFGVYPGRDVAQEATRLKAMPFWSSFIGDRRSVILVVGDYYMFGEREGLNEAEIARLIRDFGVNSPEELRRYRSGHPGEADRFVDVGERYLPTSVAFALSRIIPVMAPRPPANRLRVVLASELTPAMIKTSHIVYVGLLGGLEQMKGPVFAASRFKVGPSFDEIVDTKTNRHYTSEVNRVDMSGRSRLDYGFISSFAGPTGNRILVIAATRDVGLQQMAEEMTDRFALGGLLDTVGNAPAFEALYAVEAMEQYNMSSRLVAAGALDGARIWNSAGREDAGGR
jgi:hypothetical protein